MKRNVLINICISLVSLNMSLAISYYIYGYVNKPQKIIYRGKKTDYDFSFYNQSGQQISELSGMLKLMTDPFTIYTNYPNQKSHSYSINKYGFRDGYTGENRYTAIIIGGSAAFGYALDDNDDTFSSRLSHYSKKYNVINSAVIGFLSGQELSQMIHYLDEFKPSLYIVFDGWNDIYDPYAFAKKWPVEYGPIGYNNAFFLIEARLADYFQMTAKEKNLQIANFNPSNAPLSENEYSDKIIRTYISNISKMKSFATSRGAKFLLVFQPELGNKKILSLKEQETLNTWSSKYGYRDRKIPQRYRELISEAKKYFQEQDIPFIDINDEPRFSETPETLFFDVVHPNELGHETIAKIINRVLLERF